MYASDEAMYRPDEVVKGYVILIFGPDEVMYASDEAMYEPDETIFGREKETRNRVKLVTRARKT